MEKRFIYADNAATTQVSEEVLNAMLPYFRTAYGNASSIYKLGRDAQRDIEIAREKVANAIGADPNEIYFTSCGSESDNWAIKGVCDKLASKGQKTYRYYSFRASRYTSYLPIYGEARL